MILIISVVYTIVGIEIVKRTRAMNAINSGNFAMDDTMVAPPSEVSCSHSNEGVAVGVEFDVRSQPGNFSTSRSAEESLISTSKRSFSTCRPRTFQQPKLSSLSFRQYILMPLFFFLALLSVWVAPSTNRVASFVNPHFSSYPLMLCVGITGSLRGFWNGIVFITLGMKTWKRQKNLEEGQLHRN